jgi:L-rhamnose mutarotase
VSELPPIRLGLTATIRDDPGAVERYVEAHTEVWPSVLADARAAGVRLSAIFRDGRRLFMFVEADPGFDLDAYGSQLSSPMTLEWQRQMNALLDDQPGSLPGLKWRPLEDVIVTT